MSDSPQQTGPERVAAFLLSLERDAASKVLAHLAPDVLAEVVEAMQAIDEPNADPDLWRDLWSKVALADKRREGVQPTRGDELQTLLSHALGEEAAGQLQEKIRSRRSRERPFHQLEQAPAVAIAKVLEDESDQAVAVVLAHLDPVLSATVLASLEVERALRVVQRMTVLEPPGSDVLSLLAEDLERRVVEFADAPAPSGGASRLKTIAELLNRAPGELEREVLSGLAEEQAEMADEIREFMFTWDDIGDVDRRSMQKILGSVETRTLAISLKACSAAVEQNVLGNLSSRVRDMVSEERELAGPMPMSEVLLAREEVMRGVRALIEAGEFKPAKGGDELVS